MIFKKLLQTTLIFTLFSCSNDNDDIHFQDTNSNKVLILKVDYTTNAFEGGKELSFAVTTPNMTITNLYVQPADIGGIKLFYQELNTILFDGSIHWAGTGTIYFPQNFLNANQFESVMTADYVTPVSGFENVFNPSNTVYNYNNVWGSVQSIVKVRQYLQSNPNATVKLFLYTPSVGIGNPEEWDWIILMKN